MTEQKFLVDENMLMWAFRYALGRRTGAVMNVCDHLKMHWKKLKPQTQQQIKDEIRDYPTKYSKLGDQCDIESWEEILNLK